MPFHPLARFALGAALLSAIVFALGVIGAAKPYVLAPLGFAAITLALRHASHSEWHLKECPRWVAAIGAIYAALYLLYALTPEIQSDALNYHFTLPDSFLRTGGFPDRISFYDVLPQGMEALFAIGYGIGGGVTAKLIHFLFLLLTVPLMAVIAHQLQIGARTGWIAGLFYALTPVVGVSGTCGYTDAAMVFYVLIVFHLLLAKDHRLWAIGVCAGFCYAIKFTGGFITAAAFGVLLWQRRSLKVWQYLAGAALMILPWMIRAAVLTGNPFAPLLNAFFPNEFFHIETERNLARFLRSYGDVEWATIPLELTMYGDLLQGLLGPAWLLLPAALLALRKRTGWTLLAASVISGGAWFLNIGTRFLMPALPFLSLALFSVLPRPAAIAVLAGHAILSWPSVIAQYAPDGVWALDPEIPWRVALGIESRNTYALRKSVEHNYAGLIARFAKPTDKILDLANAPAAITPATLVNAWQSALGDRLVHSLQLGATPDRGTLIEWRSSFPARPLRGLRLRLRGSQSESASLAEVEVRDPQGVKLQPNVLWSTAAWPNVWESSLAIDNNPATGWSTWQPAQTGMYWEVDFSAPREVASIRILGHRSLGQLPFDLYGQVDEAWVQLPLTQQGFPMPGLNMRLAAMRAAKREGIRYLLAPTGNDTFGRLGRDMKDRPADWGLQPQATYDTVTLYKLQ